MKNVRVSFSTLGCRLNQSETAVIEQSFKLDGYDVVDFNKPADLVVINTCTVTEGGDTDTRRMINRATRKNPNTRIALIGCQAQVQKERLGGHPNVKWVVGNAKKMSLKDLIESLDDGQTHVITPTIERESFTQELAAVDAHRTRANMKIQDGCDFFCSFCEIPYARGRARSRRFEDVLKEAQILAEAGYKEIVLTGINLGTYQESGKKFLDVIDALEEVRSLKRIRISSIEPTTIPFELIKKMAAKNKLCPYLHIPVQSASDPVLSAMKRKYTFEEFLNFIHRAKGEVADLCVGTDVIVGFPGETDEYFYETEGRLRESPVDYFHVFSYSERQMAKSQNLKTKTNARTIKMRSRLLRELSFRKRLMFCRALSGTTQRVLFEQKKNGFWSGLTDNYARVFVGSEKTLKNKYLPVRIKQLEHDQLFGELL